jgi:hypothetical protein
MTAQTAGLFQLQDIGGGLVEQRYLQSARIRCVEGRAMPRPALDAEVLWSSSAHGRPCCSAGFVWIVHDTPNLSATTPKLGEKKVFVNGISTLPPSARALNRRAAAASVGTVIDSEKPWNPGFPAL